MESVTVATLEARRREEAARWSLQLAENRSAEREAQFQEWLHADPANRAAFEELSAMLHEVESLAGSPQIVGLRSQALRVARRSHDFRRVRALLASRPGKAAGIAALAILLGAAVYGLWPADSRLETNIGERRVVALADGSQLSMDAATELDVDYTDERRRLVLERGRAKFDVTKDPLRPFAVEAGGKVIVAIGTSFSVELVENQLRVALYDGRVEVLSAAGVARHPLQATVLTPGQELIVDAQRPPQLAPIDPQRALAWESGDLAFAGEPLALAVDRVNRYSKQPVRVAGEAAQVRISGVFHAGDTDAFIDGITTLFPVRAERRGEATVLSLDTDR